MPPQSFISLITPTSTHNGLDFGNWTTDSEWNSIIREPKEIPCAEMLSFFFSFLLYEIARFFYDFESNRLEDSWMRPVLLISLHKMCVFYDKLIIKDN